MKENLVLAAIILSVAIITAAILHNGRPCAPATAPRFQVSVGPNHAFIIDTTTGQTWEAYLASNSGSTSGDFRNVKLKD